MHPSGAGIPPIRQSTPADILHALEPSGSSLFYVDVDVNDGGVAKFDYLLQTYDISGWDWLDIYAITPDGVQNIVTNLARPGAVWGTLWQTPRLSVELDLSPWKNQNVRFVFSVVQDGWGDQTRALIYGFRVDQGCAFSPLTELTDPLSIQFEQAHGDIFDFNRMSIQIQAAYTCLRSAVINAGGAPVATSGYRPPEYQAHLQEVWDKWWDLKSNSEQTCSALRTTVQRELTKHALTARPAGSSGFHTQGTAFDLLWGPSKTNNLLPNQQQIDDLARACGLYRPLIQLDPIHFELLGSRH